MICSYFLAYKDNYLCGQIKVMDKGLFFNGKMVTFEDLKIAP